MSTAAIKVSVTIAQPFVVAGEPFSLTTTFENAHEGPVKIKRILYHIPHQVQWIHLGEYQDAWAKQKAKNGLLRFLSRTPWRAGLRGPGQVMFFAPPDDDPSLDMQASETVNYSFSALVPKWLFATGGKLTFPAMIEYEYEGARHSAEFQVAFTLRPPLRANSIGAITGALLGTISRGLRDQGPDFFAQLGIAFFTSTSLAVILSVVAVIYSSRRTGDAQPIVTVEDLWGGLLTGFLIGYAGHEYFNRLVPSQPR